VAARLSQREFIDRLIAAGERVRLFTMRLGVTQLPERLVYTLPARNDTRGRPAPGAALKYLGGRFVRPAQLRRLDAVRAGQLLYVDGRVPAWVNLTVVGRDASTTEIGALAGALIEGDPARLPRDVGASLENELAPFRIRGPGPDEVARLNCVEL
jgi:hypothetical protein